MAGTKRKSFADSEEHIDIGNSRRAAVREFKGNLFLDIREFYLDKPSGELKPGKKGISLGIEQWEKLKRSTGAIDVMFARATKA